LAKLMLASGQHLEAHNIQAGIPPIQSSSEQL
jgi:hypothetical protein